MSSNRRPSVSFGGEITTETTVELSATLLPPGERDDGSGVQQRDPESPAVIPPPAATASAAADVVPSSTTSAIPSSPATMDSQQMQKTSPAAELSTTTVGSPPSSPSTGTAAAASSSASKPRSGCWSRFIKVCCACAEEEDDELERFLAASEGTHRREQERLRKQQQQQQQEQQRSGTSGRLGALAAESGQVVDDDGSCGTKVVKAKKRSGSRKGLRTRSSSTMDALLSSMAVVEDDQPLATLKMSGNMTLLISKLRMLLTLFVPEAANVFCQFQPSENASQLVLGLEYFVYLQDTLLSPIERLEVIHRALPSSLSDPQAAVLVRACKRIALEVANTERYVEDLRKSGEVYCIRKILTPALDQQYAVEDPQVALQQLREDAARRMQEAKAAILKARAEAAAKKAERQRLKELKKKRQQQQQQQGQKVANNNNNNNSDNDDDRDDDGDQHDVVNISGNNAPSLEALLENAFDQFDETVKDPSSGADDGEDEEAVRLRTERISARITNFPCTSIKFSDIADRERIKAAAAAALRGGGGSGGAGGDDRFLFADSVGGNGGGGDDGSRGPQSMSVYSAFNGADGGAFTSSGAASASKMAGAMLGISSTASATSKAGSGGGGGGGGTGKLNIARAAAVEAALMLDENRGVSVPLRTPRMSLLDFINTWLSMDTDCSAILPEKAVIGMLHRLGVFVTYNGVRDIIASVSGSAIPITTYDISTALILYEELSTILALPVFVQSTLSSAVGNSVDRLGLGDVASAAGAGGGNDGPQQPLHSGRDIRRFLREQQFESRERVGVMLSHLGHPYAIDGAEGATDAQAKSAMNALKKQQTGFFDPKQHQQQQLSAAPTRKETLFLPRQLQFLLRDNRINSWFAPESQAVDLSAMTNMPITDFFICSSHKTYLAGPQFGAMSVSAEMIAHCLLREACRCIEIDVWEGRRGEPIVTHGGMTSASSPLADVLTVVQRCGFARTQYPLFIVLGVHGGVEFQQRLAQLFREKFGRRILRAAKVAKFIERGRPLTPEALKGKILLVATVSLEARSEVVDGTRACVPALLRLLAAHRVEAHPQWRASRGTKSAMMLWNDVEDPSHSAAAHTSSSGGTKSGLSASSSNRRSARAMAYSTSKHTASGMKWAAPRRGSVPEDHQQKQQERHKRRQEREERRRRRQRGQQDGRSGLSSSGSSDSDGDSDSDSSDASSEVVFGGSEEQERKAFEDEADESMDPLFFGNTAELMLHRLSPNTARIDSSNLDPVRHWLSGTNIAALNFQVVNDASLRCNRDIFLSSNGGTGFVPKPAVLWRRNPKRAAEVFDESLRQQMNQQQQPSSAESASGSSSAGAASAAAAAAAGLFCPSSSSSPCYVPPALPKCELRVEVLCASMLPPPLETGFSAGSGFSVLIQLTLHEVVTSSSSGSFMDLHAAAAAGGGVSSSVFGDAAATATATPPFGLSPRQSTQQLRLHQQLQRQKKEMLSKNGPRTAAPSVITHRYRTALVSDNLYGPSFDDEIWEVDVEHPNAALLTVQALACRHEEDLATPLLVGERSIFVHQLQQGVRMVPLVGQDGLRIDHPYSGVMCRFSLTPELGSGRGSGLGSGISSGRNFLPRQGSGGDPFNASTSAAPAASSSGGDDAFGPMMI